jgi:molybdopterin-guanine dinucleotide biosynthesis protein A
LVTVPCDTPNFPTDLLARLAAGLGAADGEMATAHTQEAHGLRAQPLAVHADPLRIQ